ncbi:MAG: M1 family aminopeptidase [Acidobacteriota bacterium]
MSSVALVLYAVLSAPAAGDGGAVDHSIQAHFEKMREHRYGAAATPVPAGGLNFSRDTATWTFEFGDLYLQEPVEGVATGLVFEGRGRFHMTVPDRYELRQLRRFAEAPELDAVDVPFSRLVLRTSEASALDWLGDLKNPRGAAFSEHQTAADRHRHWLLKRFEDVDARVLLGLHLADDAYLRIDMDTEDYKWLTWQYDDLALEEVTLVKFQDQNEFPEIWLSLDRPEDRTAEGRPNGVPRRHLDLRHVRVEVDLTDRSTRGAVSYSRTPVTVGQFVATVTVAPTRAGLGAVDLNLSVGAKVESVTDGDGRELAFLRERIGELTRSLDDRLNDNSLAIFFDRPVGPGDGPIELTVRYEQELLNFVSGRDWYPAPPASIDDLHTAELHLTARKRSEVRAIGRLVDKATRDDGAVTWIYAMEQPTKIHGFSFADRFVETEIEVEGVPKVVSFSPPVSSRSKSMVKSVGTDIANSLRFFQWLFDSELEVDTLQATGIAARHGQAFEGFLHLGEVTFAQDSTDTSELFRSHEVAHQWWGHLVGWKTYRDQWLSEAFAEYSSMMFVEATVKEGPEIFNDVVKAYHELLVGQRIAQFNRFVRPGMAGVDSKQRQRLGPIGHGYRASNAELPQGYRLQNYYKGPMVLHMLRHLLDEPGRGDALFIQILRDFVAEHRGGSASTEDFRRAVEERAGGDWAWFFDQWVYGTAIPSYTYSYGVVHEGDQTLLELTVTQEDVPDGFTMSVPVRLELAGGKSGTLRVTVQKPSETFRLPIPSPPKKVIFNPDFAVLARISKG